MENLEQHLLLKKYKTIERPISQYELQQCEKSNRFKLNLSNLYIQHAECKHTYLCKRFGKKYKELQENIENNDIGNCSVCWKISHTEFIFKQIARDLAAEYYSIVNNKFVSISLLHNNKNLYEYPNTGTLITALETFKTIIIFN